MSKLSYDEVKHKFLKYEDIDSINASILNWGDESRILSENLLDSSVHSPINYYLYEDDSIINIGCKYISSIIQNHPFRDGNKRTAFIAFHTFMELQGFSFGYDDDEVEDILIKFTEKQINFDELCEIMHSIVYGLQINNCKNEYINVTECKDGQ